MDMQHLLCMDPSLSPLLAQNTNGRTHDRKMTENRKLYNIFEEMQTLAFLVKSA